MSMGRVNILVTGGGGFIGSVLCPSLLAGGYAVTVVDTFLHRMNSLAPCCADPNFAVHRADCRDERIMRDLVRDMDVVIPLAAIVGAPLCQRDQTGAISINRDAVLMLTRILSREQRILLPVTNSGYGIGEAGKECTEDSPLRPISLYGSTKVEAEKAVLDRGNAISFRLATVFGMSPRMRIDLLVNDFVYRAVTDRAVVLFEEHFKRNYVHVRDVARVFEHGMKLFESMRDRPYNVGLDDANLSKSELCQVIQKHIPQFVFLAAPIGEDPDQRDYIVSNQRLLATGFRPQWSLDRGIEELMKGYRTLSHGTYSNA